MRPGDYVSVIETVWDPRMPQGINARRDGIILETTGPKFVEPDQAIVLLSNGAMLKFHKSQLCIIKSKEEFYL